MAYINSTAEMLNITSTPSPFDEKNLTLGFICTFISCFFFGINYLPVKKVETGDGMFFQLVLCSTIWICGLITDGVMGSPKFYPLVMLGGCFWATGNIFTVPIIKTVGLGIGILIWGSFNLLSGWVSGRFGWFGMKPQIPTYPILNYVGVGLAFFRSIIFVFIKTEVESESNTDVADESFYDRLPVLGKRFFGCGLSAIAGLLYGFMFKPAIYIQDNWEGASQNGLDYVFSHYCGLFATSWFWFMIYCMFMKNKPRVYPKAVLPGVASGLMWSIAHIAWFVANKELYESVSFPILLSVAPIVGAVCGVIFFGEIRGKKNFILLGIALIVTIVGAVLTGLSIEN